nr:MAG TPA: hypothetical protein [Caudoviricetes sp.]
MAWRLIGKIIFSYDRFGDLSAMRMFYEHPLIILFY